MVRTSKSDKQTSAPAAAPVAAPVVQQVAADDKKASKKAAKPKAVEPEVAAAPAPAVVPVVEQVAADAAVETDASLDGRLNVFSGKLQQWVRQGAALTSELKVIQKLAARERKNAQKLSSRKRGKGEGKPRPPSGFVKPTRISDELAQFLGKAIGTEMSRTDVSKEITSYIRTHGLPDKENGRNINADAKLSALLKLSKDDKLTYFNLQRYMKHHFIKASVATA